MENKIRNGIVLMFVIIFTLTSCKKDHGINLFTKKQDIELGLQMKSQIEESSDYVILDSDDYPEAYNHLYRIRDEIMNNASDLSNKDVFEWEVYIIDNDDVLNAFACPGGFMYFYTGLIKYLDNESQFAGVMAHEMAHVELRHSTRQLTTQYGYSIMVDMIFGKADSKLDSVVRGVTGNLTFLKFSKDYEYQADEYAVKFLSDTKYDPRGVAGFFEKLENEEERGSKIPTFLSTHPSPEDRIEQIYLVWEDEGSHEGADYTDDYNDFKDSLTQ